MNREVKHRLGQGAGVLPESTAVLAVIAHPDDALFGLGGILDAFVFAGAKVEVLCLTHGQAWTLEGAPGDLAALRGAELASAADVLGPLAQKADCPDGSLSELGQAKLVDEVIAAADSCLPDGLLVFDTAAVEGQLDHVTATSAGLMAAETLALPVLGWLLSEEVVAQPNQGLGNWLTSQQDEDVDLRVTLERDWQRVASHSLQDSELPGSTVAPARASRQQREPSLAALGALIEATH